MITLKAAQGVEFCCNDCNQAWQIVLEPQAMQMDPDVRPKDTAIIKHCSGCGAKQDLNSDEIEVMDF